MKKGFTLIEIVAVVSILALLLILAIPPIIQQINQKKNEVSEAMQKILKNAASLNIQDHTEDYPEVEGNIYCITLQSLVNQGYLQSPITDPTTQEEIPLTTYIKVIRQSGDFQYEVSSTCQNKILN